MDVDSDDGSLPSAADGEIGELTRLLSCLIICLILIFNDIVIH